MTGIHTNLHKYKLVIDKIFIEEVTEVFDCLKIKKKICKIIQNLNIEQTNYQGCQKKL